jgi:adenine-specific DNA-methyltransferase
MQRVLAIYRANPKGVAKKRAEERDGELHLTMEQKREILLQCIYGVDIDPQAVSVAQLSLYLKLMEDETTYSARHQQIEMGAALLPSLNNNIVEGNSLVTALDNEDTDLFSVRDLSTIKALDFHEVFLDVFKQDGFDLVIGNPPYIKEYVNRNAFDHVRTSPYYQGKMDIWYLFACRAIDWLKPDGLLAFIATNNWVTNSGAKKLRAKVRSETKIEQLIDFGEFKVFRDAAIQTMILITRKTDKPKTYEIDFRRLKGKKPTFGAAQALLQKQHDSSCEYLSSTVERTSHDGSAPLTFSNSKIQDVLKTLLKKRNFWPAAGSEDTELGVLLEPEVGHGEAEVYTRVQA